MDKFEIYIKNKSESDILNEVEKKLKISANDFANVIELRVATRGGVKKQKAKIDTYLNGIDYHYLMVIYLYQGKFSCSFNSLISERACAEKECHNYAGIEYQAYLEFMLSQVKEKEIESYLINAINRFPEKLIKEQINRLYGDWNLRSHNYLCYKIFSRIQSKILKEKLILSEKEAIDLLEILAVRDRLLQFKAAYIDVLSKKVDRIENNYKSGETIIGPIRIGIIDAGVNVNVLGNVKKFEELDLSGSKDIANEENSSLREIYQGYKDTYMGIQTKVSIEFKRLLEHGSFDEIKKTFGKIVKYVSLSHGTGICYLFSQNIQEVEIYSVKMPMGLANIPTNMEEALIFAKKVDECFDFLSSKKVKIVNMSFSNSIENIKMAIDLKNKEIRGEGREMMAAEIFRMDRDQVEGKIKTMRNVFFVIGAGNSNDNLNWVDISPACLNMPNSATVGAVTSNGIKTEFTNYGKKVDVYAEGYNIRTIGVDGNSNVVNGTSYSTAIVGNFISKIIIKNPDVNTSELKILLKKRKTIMRNDLHGV
jgi:hypothetical protein